MSAGRKHQGGTADWFLIGMGLSTDSFKHGASRWKLHLMVQLSTFALFPLWWLLLNALVEPAWP